MNAHELSVGGIQGLRFSWCEQLVVIGLRGVHDFVLRLPHLQPPHLRLQLRQFVGGRNLSARINRFQRHQLGDGAVLQHVHRIRRWQRGEHRGSRPNCVITPAICCCSSAEMRNPFSPGPSLLEKYAPPAETCGRYLLKASFSVPSPA